MPDIPFPTHASLSARIRDAANELFPNGVDGMALPPAARPPLPPLTLEDLRQDAVRRRKVVERRLRLGVERPEDRAERQRLRLRDALLHGRPAEMATVPPAPTYPEGRVGPRSYPSVVNPRAAVDDFVTNRFDALWIHDPQYGEGRSGWHRYVEGPNLVAPGNLRLAPEQMRDFALRRSVPASRHLSRITKTTRFAIR